MICRAWMQSTIRRRSKDYAPATGRMRLRVERLGRRPREGQKQTQAVTIKPIEAARPTRRTARSWPKSTRISNQPRAVGSSAMNRGASSTSPPSNKASKTLNQNRIPAMMPRFRMLVFVPLLRLMGRHLVVSSREAIQLRSCSGQPRVRWLHGRPEANILNPRVRNEASQQGP